MRILRWVVPIAILAVAFGLRFWALDRPGTLVFDELYYVRDAISQLAHGFPTEWPDDLPNMSGARATAFTDEASNAVHPPLGKWLIGLGVLVFGPESGWGWRSAAALTGVATVGVTMRLGFLLTRSHLIAWFAGLLLALDGVHIALSRVGLLDVFLTFFVVLGALFVWRDLSGPRAAGHRIHWRRPWLLTASFTFGAAAAVKWSGLYPLAFFLVLITVCDAVRRFREGSSRPLTRAALQACVTAAIAFPAALLAYFASWAGWFATASGWARATGDNWLASLANYHAEMLGWHSTLSAPHPYQANPLGWPIALRPTAMYRERWGTDDGCPWASGCVAEVAAIPNPLITWGGVLALAVLVWLLVRLVRPVQQRLSVSGPFTLAAIFIIVGYLSGWLPWVLTFSRSAVFQFYAVVLTPFAALALALVLGMLCGESVRSRDASHREGSAAPSTLIRPSLVAADPAIVSSRRIAVALLLAAAALLTALFFPLWSGAPVAEWFWRAHMWLPGWV